MKTGVEFLLMKLLIKAGLLIFALTTLNSCGPSTYGNVFSPMINTWEHYEKCSYQYNDMVDIAQCGKNARNSYLAGARGSGIGNSYVIFVDSLASAVASGGMENHQAKIEWARYTSEVRQEHKKQLLGIASSGAFDPPKTTTTTTTTGSTTKTCTVRGTGVYKRVTCW